MTSPFEGLPTRRSQVQICPCCGHLVLRANFIGWMGWTSMVVDPSPYQRLVANLLIPERERASWPSWCYSPGYAVPHVCSSLGNAVFIANAFTIDSGDEGEKGGPACEC